MYTALASLERAIVCILLHIENLARSVLFQANRVESEQPHSYRMSRMQSEI